MIDLDAQGMAIDALRRVRQMISPATFGAVGDGVADDTQALTRAIAAAALVRGRVQLDRYYRVTAPIGTLLTTPVTIIGSGSGTCGIIVDPALVGDVLSFRNCWYGAESIRNASGTPIAGNPVVGYRRDDQINGKKGGVTLRGFSVLGDRSAASVQNGVMFYDRNDAVVLDDLWVECIRGTALCLSGLASNPAANASAYMRESQIRDVHVRWCGDIPSGRPSVVMSATSKTLAQVGGNPASITDDANNYVIVDNLKIIFSEGVALQANDMSLGSGHVHDNGIEVIVDSQRGPAATPNYISGGQLPGANWSITNGVLTVSSVAGFLRYSGVGAGDLAIGCFLFHASIPPGTYLASGPSAGGGVGTYQLANRQVDVSTLSIVVNSGTLRAAIPAIEIGGGHGAEKWKVGIFGSGTANSNQVGIVYSQNPLNTNQTKTGSGCTLELDLYGGDVGVDFRAISQLDMKLLGFGVGLALNGGTITQAVTVDVQYVGTGKSHEPFVSGNMQNLHVYPGGQRIVTGTDINNVMTPGRWPNAYMILDNGGTYTRWHSRPQPSSYNTCVWTAA